MIREMSTFSLMSITSECSCPHGFQIEFQLHFFFRFICLCRDTYVERVAGESANDRNDRAIRVATAWYEKHLKLNEREQPIRVVLLSDDRKNLEKAREEGILCCTVGDYVRTLDKHPTLQDKLSHNDFSTNKSKEAIFPPHLTPNEIHDGIKSGKLLQGSFQASRENYLEGFVNVEGMEKSVSKF